MTSPAIARRRYRRDRRWVEGLDPEHVAERVAAATGDAARRLPRWIRRDRDGALVALGTGVIGVVPPRRSARVPLRVLVGEDARRRNYASARHLAEMDPVRATVARMLVMASPRPRVSAELAAALAVYADPGADAPPATGGILTRADHAAEHPPPERHPARSHTAPRAPSAALRSARA